MKWVMPDSLCLFLSLGISLEVLTVDLRDLKGIRFLKKPLALKRVTL